MESKQNELFILHDEDKQKRSTERQKKKEFGELGYLWSKGNI